MEIYSKCYIVLATMIEHVYYRSMVNQLHKMIPKNLENARYQVKLLDNHSVITLLNIEYSHNVKSCLNFYSNYQIYLTSKFTFLVVFGMSFWNHTLENTYIEKSVQYYSSESYHWNSFALFQYS